MQTADFDYSLPDELIAQTPAPQRDQSRLLVLDRAAGDSGMITHRRFSDLPGWLRAGDVLVLNDSRVIPARLHGFNARTGGRFEILLLEENAPNDWWAMLRPGKRGQTGAVIGILDRSGKPANIQATVTEINAEGHRRLRFSDTPDVSTVLPALGGIPLPPYITRPDGGDLTDDQVRYQTVYATREGSVAAPTAGLHFTEAMLAELRALGVQICAVTLHVGPGTFTPVKTEDPAGHVLHEERFEVGGETAQTVNAARQEGRRIVAVGTTTVRVLETAARAHGGRLVSGSGRTRIFIYPPCDFTIVDALLTNFHLPRSTLLMLVSAFAAPGETRGRDRVLAAYAAAIRERYRFFSYGDAMLLV